MIELRTLEIFYWVVQLGGFRRAAERLHTTQPAVSARIAALESAIGARVLERDRRRRVLPTPRGAELWAYAARMLALQAEMHTAMTAPEELRGTVRLGTSETIVHTWLNRLLRRLHEQYPNLTVDLSVDISTQLRAGLLGGEIDVAMLLGPVAAPGVMDVPLCAYPLVWVARPGTEARTLAEFARHPLITYARGTGPHEQLSALFQQQRARIFANSSLSSIVRMVLDGIGIGVIARAAIGAELASGALRVLDGPPLAPLSFTASYVTTPGSGLAAAVARLAAEVASDPQS